jgi:hypothetical protein
MALEEKDDDSEDDDAGSWSQQGLISGGSTS